MWTGWVTLTLASACSLYVMQADNDDQAQAVAGTASTLAASMALYRDAVVQYTHLHPAFTGRVPDDQLALPAWYAAPQPALWSNSVDSAGTILVYATRLPAVDIAEPLAALAQGSELAGRASLKTMQVVPAARTGTAVTLPTGAGSALPDGAPVWLAYRY